MSSRIGNILAINTHIQHVGPLTWQDKPVLCVALDGTLTWKSGEESAMSDQDLIALCIIAAKEQSSGRN